MSNNTTLSSLSPPFFFLFVLCLFSNRLPCPCFFAFLSFLFCPRLPNSSSSFSSLIISDYPLILLHLCPSHLPSVFQIIASLDEDPAAQSKQLTLRLQQIAAALENKVTDL